MVVPVFMEAEAMSGPITKAPNSKRSSQSQKSGATSGKGVCVSVTPESCETVAVPLIWRFWAMGVMSWALAIAGAAAVAASAISRDADLMRCFLRESCLGSAPPAAERRIKLTWDPPYHGHIFRQVFDQRFSSCILAPKGALCGCERAGYRSCQRC